MEMLIIATIVALVRILNNIKHKKMFRKGIVTTTTQTFNESVEGETIESKVRRLTVNKEPIDEGAETIYTEAKKGVLPEYDVRTDRFEIAIDAMSKVDSDRRAKREERWNPKPTEEEGQEGGEAGENSEGKP